MKYLIQELENTQKFKEYISDVKNKISPIELSGLADVGKVQIISATSEVVKRPILIITYNEIKAKKMLEDLKYFMKNIDYFPRREIVAYDYEVESKDIPYERIEVLNKIKENKTDIVITTVEALMQKMISKELLYKYVIQFKIGDTYDLETIKQNLILLGYERNDLVENKGQFSIRGGIVDIGLSEKQGIRIEFWGDEVDSIRYFNIASQRSTEMVQEVLIKPAHEFIVENIEDVCKKIEQKYNEQSDIEMIRNGSYISKIDKYFNEFYEEQNTILDYINKNYIIFIDENSKIEARKNNIILDNNNLIKSLIEKEKFIPETIKNISGFEYDLKNMQTIYLQESDLYTHQNRYEFRYRTINFFKSEIDIVIADIKTYINDNKKIIILGGTQNTCKKILNLLNDRQIPHKYAEKIENVKNGEVIVTLGSISSGFECYDLKLVVINMSEGLEQVAKRKKSSNAFKEAQKVVYADLKPGDYVVHKSHGIGEFIGINTITADKVTKDYIKIKYKDEDILYVPTSSLDTVRKYIGTGDKEPRLNRLGSKEWENTKNRVKNNLREVAKDLIELYAKRQKMQGFAFSKDNEWQKQFEDEFPYQETDDQLRCIEEAKKDMEQAKPMDRLLCGDVGYGKTEVAIRLAFKAVMDQKQVAYLVPTTVLANQQYEEFKTRMSEFAINVELLNRFRTTKEQENVIKKLKLGEIDIVIGTHRILSKDVEFKDLGLLIIDEEHRFGVQDKEKIKQLKNSVDVLTMTATPIPRTLHMSILGIRDMSVIYEPPQNRRPVQTYVLEYDDEVVKEAITREIERNGQVFYLYNKVEGIEKKSNEVSKLVPEAKVGFAHGKMTGKELEQIMMDFIQKKIDVLVCTTILESGIDIPNANTIIVENADRLGLAQLYQIRGRVGRSDRQAYAYITYKREKLLSEVADKRLKAIKEFTEFGSGFKIAMRDLEIRGAGSLLGEIQHGHMEQVGYDTYCRLLDEVVKEMKGIEVKEEQDIQLDIDVSSYIPDNFIESNSQKIEIYQNIALCRTEEDIQNVIDEIIDRYGHMPEELENLIEIARIKNLCKEANVLKISQRKDKVVFYFDKSKFNPEIVDKLIKKYSSNIRFSTGVEPYITLNIGNKIIEEIKAFLTYVK
ncbi:MAG TPA: transcription-repair coupling factor [Clostridiales bacterium]|jgi:transcription-repair coupling factor (superfamily II helicase)|nr:transcription-repair coupling factor [Clostridiales bacterium]